jgi:hypothetical protein
VVVVVAAAVGMAGVGVEVGMAGVVTLEAVPAEEVLGGITEEVTLEVIIAVLVLSLLAWD